MIPHGGLIGGKEQAKIDGCLNNLKGYDTCPHLWTMKFKDTGSLGFGAGSALERSLWLFVSGPFCMSSASTRP